MYEPWVLDVKLEGPILDPVGPDRPLYHDHGPVTVSDKRNLSKWDHTGRAMVQLIQSTTCLRKFFSEYLHDHSSSGIKHIAKYLYRRSTNPM